MDIKLKKINQKYARHLTKILNTDIKLAKMLGQKENNMSDGDFTLYLDNWRQKTNSVSFAIIKDESAIGMISLSHRNFNNSTARVGYWISSNYWNNGYATAAFQLIVDLARKDRFKRLNSYIDANNAASLLVWKKFGAIFTEHNEGLTASIELQSKQKICHTGEGGLYSEY